MNIIITPATILPAFFVIPVVPTNVTMSHTESKNNIINTTEGLGVEMGHSPLRILSWRSYFPVKSVHNFAPNTKHQNGWEYLEFLELMRRFKLPIRVIGTEGAIPIYNFLASIEELTWSLDKAKDINYSIKLREFPEKLIDFVGRDKQAWRSMMKYLKDTQLVEKLEKLGLTRQNFGEWLERL